MRGKGSIFSITNSIEFAVKRTGGGGAIMRVIGQEVEGGIKRTRIAISKRESAKCFAMGQFTIERSHKTECIVHI